ncbi:hypothetical protein KUCAC02_027371, partial [Chaenocephalus aceratus]
AETPIFFINSMHKRWIFGKKGCEIYAFCGALFGICSMITLMVIAVDRYVVITRPLASLGGMSRRKALCILAAAWVYSAGWSLPPFFGWSAYVPEAIRHTTRAITQMNCQGTRDSAKKFNKIKTEWKMAKIALIVSAPAGIFLTSGYCCVLPGRDRLTSSSFQSTRRSTVTSQSESKGPSRLRNSSLTESESARFSDTEEDLSSRTPDIFQLSGDTKQVRHANRGPKVRGRNTGEFESTAAHNPTDPAICNLSQITTLTEPEDISMTDIGLQPTSHQPATLDNGMEESGPRIAYTTTPSIIVTSISSPAILHCPPGFHGDFKLTKRYSLVVKEPLDIARMETTALP